MKKAIVISIILAGATAMASQIVLLREFLIVFYGNELSLGLILASWLIWGAVGSWFLGRITRKAQNQIAWFCLCQFTLSIFLPLSIIAIRSIKPFLNIVPGEIIALFPMVISSFIILAPVCMLFGLMFSLGCRIYEEEPSIKAGNIARVYILEAIGSIIGGLLVSFILIRLLPSLHIMAILSGLNILAVLLLQSYIKQNKFKPILIISLVAIILLTLFKGWDKLHSHSLHIQWQGYKLLTSQNSIYANIAVTKRDSQYSFFDNGLHLYTVPDKLSSEEAVHFALLEHPAPQDVLLIGGGVGGLVQEIIKHPIKSIDYMELDPLIIKLAKDYLPKENYLPLIDSRVEIKNLDGRFFIKRTNKLYDCVILHLGEPYTAQINRFYTVEFFKEVKRVLKPDGIVSFTLTSSESYLSKELAEFLRSIYASLGEVFSDVKVIPGDTAYFLASNTKGLLTYDYKILMQRLNSRNIEAEYVREYYLFSKLSVQKVSYIEETLKRLEAVKINYDARPISYYYDIVFWSSLFKDSLFKKALQAINEKGILKTAFGIYGLILLWGVTGLGRKEAYKKAVMLAVMSTGFAELTFQVVVLLSFQIIYGYVFYKLGLILTSFMIGLTLGGFCIVKAMSRIKKDRALFIWTQVSICIYPLLLPLFFWWLAGSKSEITSWWGQNILFPFLPVVAGFIGGFQFPLANKIYLQKEKDTGSIAGFTYAVDLSGACLGAIFTGAFLIPILGLPQTCLLVAIMNFVVLIVLILNTNRHEFLSNTHE